MKIYTKTGDAGETSLYGGQRVSKADARVEAYGTVDETNAALGVARAHGVVRDVDALLEQIQNDLFVVGGELACPPERVATLGMALIDSTQIEALEQAIDRYEAELQPLRSFVLPGGSIAASALHLARAVCRRAERLVVTLSGASSVRNELVVYLNRLSDLLFVLARHANKAAFVTDVAWAPRKR
jgi:cob(I)alamin adenosyltransferase